MCVNEEELNEMEIYYIAKFNSTDRTIGYNLTFGGDGVVGFKHTEETRKKLSDAHRGKPSPMKGKCHSSKAKEKMSASRKGKPKSPEHKAKMADSHKGKHLSEATKQKISEAHQGVTPANKGKTTKRLKWLTPDGEIVEMDKGNVNRWHPDYILFEE